MTKYVCIIFFALACIILLSSQIAKEGSSTIVKANYLQQASLFATEAKALNDAINDGDEKLMRTQFLKTRAAYKTIELIVEYFFPAYAIKINGPPIPFYEDSEPEKGAQAPAGLQLLESYLFPTYDKKLKKDCEAVALELLRISLELPTVNESEVFSDANIFDAVMEELYRITALSITGFDSQVAVNSLSETIVSLQSVQEVLNVYENQLENVMPGMNSKTKNWLGKAALMLRQAKSFDSFDRMYFTREYLNPLAQIIGEYKTRNAYKDNQGGQYYSAVVKSNTLFNPLAFDPFRFIDDYTISGNKIKLGRKLFFDSRLSASKKRSCASCHQPGRAFTDGLKTSTALDGHTALPRNAPTILNAALQRNLFADLRTRTLEDQVMAVLNNTDEMHGNAANAAEEIIKLKDYDGDYKKAYPNAPIADAAVNICNAIASFERRLIALNSRFDQHMRNENSLSTAEVNGYNIFMGKGKCGTCHFTPLFNGSRPPRYYASESEVIGVPLMPNKKNATISTDSGRYRITKLPMHLFAFKTPTLRNAALTAPYMHNGVFKSLEEVVNFYNEGGGKGLGIAPVNQTLPFDKLNLTTKEKKNLVLFIKSLTDTSINMDAM